METKFTKGEWSYLKTGLNETCIFSDLDMEHIFKINHNEVEGSQAEGNAKLISAAPDLLESCIELFEYYKNEVSIPNLVVLRKAQEAIKKATE